MGKINSRSTKAIYNGISGIIYELITIICGLILPRLILSAFGSSYNGITQSITQFLSFVTLLRAGVGAVTKAALYKPLALKDKNQVSRIIRATEIFMQKVAFIFAIGLLLFAIIYPFIVRDEFQWLFSFSLVLIIGISTFAQYYFGITYQMLLEADQCQYIVSVVQAITTILNVIIATILINFGAGIHLVKLGSSIVFIMNPIAINLIVKHRYNIVQTIEPDNTALRQRWDAFAQQLAMLVRDNTDIIILTLVSSTLEVSVYTVYFMVIKAINSIIRAFTNGVGAAFGNMLAKGEIDEMKKNLRIYELVVYSLTTVLYSCVCVLITPFVVIYTQGIHDVNYNRPLFGYILSFAYIFFCIRIPYQNIVEVAGHFKQTKKGAYFEAFLNLFSSIFLGWKFGIIGVAIGTLLAMSFRTFQYAIYVAKNLVIRKHWEFIRHFIICFTNIFLIITICDFLPLQNPVNYFIWVINAFVVFLFSVFITLLFDVIFYKNELFTLIKKYILKRKM